MDKNNLKQCVEETEKNKRFLDNHSNAILMKLCVTYFRFEASPP